MMFKSNNCSGNRSVIIVRWNSKKVCFCDKSTKISTEVENYITNKFGYWENTEHTLYQVVSLLLHQHTLHKNE